ncbi:RsmD family RNA methyltransferase [Aureliella helgolandensis]|uniref:Ribosomal RNA small subunit methyltransferase D n=1 Tax=Aureliella helgolandensis TaxID=2527968 RepID=A0A518G8K2_9BACT|nr:RsmD family RNA methyltransferase [Aureliella helgolandensis]QDV24912.1 Ribosomal RNA small subunit methyltransferase D [Aureliella helgolandensis]
MARKKSRTPHDIETFPSRRPKQVKPKLVPTRLRIVAGSMGGRKITYNGDPATRPMKEKTREAVFSLLGGYLYNTQALDLFGGTGILGFEAISRGAERATILELTRPAIASILANMRDLQLEELVDVHNVDTLRWLRSIPLNTASWPELPWIVFCCPPYRMWTSDSERLAAGIQELYDLSPVGSQFICEAEVPFDLPAAIPGMEWDIRTYLPAIVGLCVKQ